MVRQLLYFLAHEVVSRIANASIQSPIEGGVLWASDALTIEAHISKLTEAAAFIPIFVESAGGGDKGRAGLGGTIVDLFGSAGTA